MAVLDWLEWSDASFEQARALKRPVLLLVRASWCRFCRELEQSVLAAERVEHVLRERFVCVRVDKDRRPDIDARYSKGGWPTLAWLDDTGELLASDTYMDAGPLLARAELVADFYERHRDTIRARIAEFEAKQSAEEPALLATRARSGPKLSLEIVEHVAHTILETADPTYGGWGREHKFPQTEALDFALIRWSQTGDAAMLQLVLRTLRCMQEGEIHDRTEGGFYRYATKPDWSAPNHEKMLDSNAQRLFAYLEGWQAFGDESFKRTAEGILSWMQGTLWDRELHAFRGSQDADPAYAHLPMLGQRRTHGAPPCDPTIFTNWNAQAASTLFKAAAVLDDEAHARTAESVLAFLLEELYDESRGMYHYWDGTYHLAGLLSDQACMLRALLDAYSYSGDSSRLVPARRLADLALENLLAQGGGFYDTRFDPAAQGGLRRRNRSILENSIMAEALLRLAHLSGVSDYADAARETLESFAGDYKRFGHFTAGYARAVDLFFHEPVRVTIVGRCGARDTAALAAAARRPYVASRIVQILDPERDRALLESFHLPSRPAGEPAHAYVQRGRESYADTVDPLRLPALMTRIERGS
jgi:uncharacterized protein YyaL (SSP411 family)